MLVLRPLQKALFGELRLHHDVNNVLPGELLVTTPRPCANAVSKKGCLCSRAFIGCTTGAATTLATVIPMEESGAIGEFIESHAAAYWWGTNPEAFAVDYLMRFAAALEAFAPGDVIRVQWREKGAGLYRACLYDEAAAMEALKRSASGDEA